MTRSNSCVMVQRMKKMTLFLLGLTFLFGCTEKKESTSPQVRWQEEVSALDREIGRLVEKSEEYRKRSNEEERKAILYMRSDWPKYSTMMQEVEKDQDFASDMDRYVKELRARKQKIIDAHQYEQPLDEK